MSLYLNFRGTFTNSWGHTKSSNFYLLTGLIELFNIRKFLLNFYLNLSSMSIVLALEGMSIDDREVVSAIALVVN